jgi:hypothetical protein
MELRPPRKRHLLPCIPCLSWFHPTPSNPRPSIRAHLCSSVVETQRKTQQHRGSDGTSPSPKNTNSFRGSPPHRTTPPQDFPHTTVTGLGNAAPLVIISHTATQQQRPRRAPCTSGHTRFQTTFSNADTPQPPARAAVSRHHRKHNHVDPTAAPQPGPGRA